MKGYRTAAVLAIAALALIGACSSSSDSGGSTSPTITSMSDLPRATSPMAASASAQVAKGVEKAASTGMVLSTTDSDFFSSDSSMGSCEMFNLVKEGITSAAQADMILCFVQYMNTEAVFDGVTDSSGNAINIYDGEYHVFNLNIQQCTTDADCAQYYETATCNASNRCELDGVIISGPPDRVRMKIVKDAAGSITDFEMFMCSYIDGELTQSEYTSQTISDSTLTMRAIGQHSDVQGSGWHSADVSGTLDADGVYTEKAITIRNNGNWGGEGNLSWEEGTLTQTPGSFYFSGYRAGEFSQGTDSGTYEQASYGLGEMVGDTSADVSLLAMGDGAVQYHSVGTYNNQYGQGSYEEGPAVDAWLGDTGLPVDPASDSSYYNTANDGDLPTVQSSVISIDFAANETWDCSGDAVDLGSESEATIQAACSEYSFDHSWVDCYQVIQQEQQ